MDAVVNRLRAFDAYPKTLDDFRVKTYSGAIISIISGAFILFLFVSELSAYLSMDTTTALFVDTSLGDQLQINIDFTFHKMACSYISLDAMDVSGEYQLDVDHNIFKKRLDGNGKAISGFEKDSLGREKPVLDVSKLSKELPADYCGSCYGSEEKPGMCCNTCEQVRESYRKKGWAFSNADGIEQCVREGWSDTMRGQSDEGCNLSGHLKVNKVAGNFHFAPGKSFQQHHMHVHDLQVFNVPFFNMSHTINRLSFGKVYPGIVNPLDNAVRAVTVAGSAMFQYFVKIVPTIYSRADGTVINTNQFSATEHFKILDSSAGMSGLPGVFFMYDLSPMVVKINEKATSFAHFLTGVCAIVGGVFTVAGLVDAAFYHGYRTLAKKMELGKAN